MQESPFYQFVAQRNYEQCSREMSTKNILSVLTERFPQSDLQPVEQALESILDLDHLSTLLRTAVQTSSVEAFSQALNASEV